MADTPIATPAGRAALAGLPGEVQVLISGGGPSGLFLALDLAGRGIPSLVIEPRDAVDHTRPRAKTTNARTMTHLRRLGLADAVRAAAPLPVGYSQDVAFCTGLTGPAAYELRRFRNAFQLVPGRYGPQPEAGQQIPHRLPGQPGDADPPGTGYRAEQRAGFVATYSDPRVKGSHRARCEIDQAVLVALAPAHCQGSVRRGVRAQVQGDELAASQTAAVEHAERREQIRLGALVLDVRTVHDHAAGLHGLHQVVSPDVRERAAHEHELGQPVQARELADAVDDHDFALRRALRTQRHARAAAREGFTGKLAIHPAQVGPINAAFTPTDEELAHAMAIIDAFSSQPDAGVLSVGGKMVDRPHLVQAERVIARRR